MKRYTLTTSRRDIPPGHQYDLVIEMIHGTSNDHPLRLLVLLHHRDRLKRLVSALPSVGRAFMHEAHAADIHSNQLNAS